MSHINLMTNDHNAHSPSIKTILAADLFCGAGGTSTGLQFACDDAGLRLDLLAINHWNVAIATHTANHPNARHLCESLDTVDPRKIVPGGRLHVLCASPECTHHSIARGGRPISDQSRASAWHILRWAEALYIDNILIENVREFESWGPLGADGRPLQSKKGQTFSAFIAALRSLGYNVEWRVLTAADYGDPTTRERLFIMARRGNRKITWPEPTHARTADCQGELFGTRKPWRPAREIIDWSIASESIFNRKRPLADTTVARIAAGVRRFGGTKAEPFLVILRNNMAAQSLDLPVPTVTASGQHIALCSPFLVPTNHGKEDTRSYDIDAPMPTLTTVDAWGLIEPFLVKYYGTGVESSLAEPTPTITTKDRFGLVELDSTTLDIRFRMLQPHELARAQGFPKKYQFTGTRSAKVKQIGNAVPCGVARALCSALLSGYGMDATARAA